MRAVTAGLRVVSAVTVALLVALLPIADSLRAVALPGLTAATTDAATAHAASGPDLQAQSLAIPTLSGTYYYRAPYTATITVRNVGDTAMQGDFSLTEDEVS